MWQKRMDTVFYLYFCFAINLSCRQDFGVLAIPTVPESPPKLQTDPSTLQTFRARAFSLLSIAGVSGFCQVSIPLGLYDNLPVSVSLLAKHGLDGFLLNLVETLYPTIKEELGLQ
ncbi:hypothetical protein FEM48_ZijujUnG0027800 [Ziziphus jujuba var. spinosa]|uniref:Amidase 1-like n=1 Tax=Ziziphus jujuba var. spinosa TaxID=714518 RepID=A0A978U9M0_ZIZJJ|nr:hypothetical protein FEM48_ZijujUnG0027800 [Ziziphus jujuba var. spinosa]